MAKEKDPSSKGKAKKNWSIEDEASWESFPASDPPAYLIKGPKKNTGTKEKNKK